MKVLVYLKSVDGKTFQQALNVRTSNKETAKFLIQQKYKKTLNKVVAIRFE